MQYALHSPFAHFHCFTTNNGARGLKNIHTSFINDSGLILRNFPNSYCMKYMKMKSYMAGYCLAQITKLSRPRFSKTLVLVKFRI